MELDKKLKTLNKHPVKSFKTELGYTYDFINIYKQPAFDHPLLRNHKIQMKPNLIHREQVDEPIFNTVSSVVRSKLEGCPSETVPIRRTTKEELVNAKHLSNGIKRRHYVSAQPFAEKVYYGSSAKIYVTNPTVDPDKFSTAQIWIRMLFGDNKTRVFGLWTVQTGCYNILCPGFVQVHPKYSFGEYIGVGTYGGIQRVFDFSVHRDPERYWPKEIFTHLAENASVIGYGGVAGADLGEPTPPMGHGYLLYFNTKYTCYMFNMKVANNRGKYFNFDTSKVQLDHDAKTSCYDLIVPGRDIFRGIMMFFGGPGGDCP
ncbi:hypothetical protein MKW98_020189 [Papaver atlanticum]|uniref:Neprosin PEP catalytic domain-containing protein n=1 Tax=Papaver atlanticum TaxID=357466 RepID=A0AAD4XA06_9MAGN|nr:hypothetical protein MKW98_020189 [Papaver atlanticum]